MQQICKIFKAWGYQVSVKVTITCKSTLTDFIGLYITLKRPEQSEMPISTKNGKEEWPIS